MNIKKTIKKIIRIIQTPLIFTDYFVFKKRQTDNRFRLSLVEAYPCVKDKTVKTGFDRHYVYHTSWAARKVMEINPEFHTDISSSLYFVGIVSAFIPVKFYDYRPAEVFLDNLECLKADLSKLPFKDESIYSLSCMHVIEHIGLGRYGEPLDSDGDLKAIKELKRVLAKEGSLLFVVPIGNTAKIEFNAHRIYTYKQIREYFSDLTLKEFFLIPENSGRMVSGKDVAAVLDNEKYACGCFWFVKNSDDCCEI